MTETIDSHHHLWRHNEAEYEWIPPHWEMLKRDFLAEELGREMTAAKVDGAVVVQARQSVEETRWLLACARESHFIRGVVGWLPLLDGDLPGVLRELGGSDKLKGARHVVQSEAEGFLLRKDFNSGIAALLPSGLVFDLLIHDGQLPEAAEFVRHHPEQIFVLDHEAKPQIRTGAIEPWRTNLFSLARAGNVYCKVSGMVTEADCKSWTVKGLTPYLNVAMEAFGPERLMVGSDWPVCLAACGYGRWWEVVREWLQDIPVEQRDLILGDTAKRVYRL